MLNSSEKHYQYYGSFYRVRKPQLKKENGTYELDMLKHNGSWTHILITDDIGDIANKLFKAGLISTYSELLL